MKANFNAISSDRKEEQRRWFNGKPGEKLLDIKWEPFRFSKGIAKPIYQQKTDWFTYDYVVYYVACWVELKEDRDLIVCVGSDDGNKLWINGDFIGEFYTITGRGVVADSERYHVRLNKGKNFVLFKVIQGGGGL